MKRARTAQSRRKLLVLGLGLSTEPVSLQPWTRFSPNSTRVTPFQPEPPRRERSGSQLLIWPCFRSTELVSAVCSAAGLLCVSGFDSSRRGWSTLVSRTLNSPESGSSVVVAVCLASPKKKGLTRGRRRSLAFPPPVVCVALGTCCRKSADGRGR
ncbi:clustered mitochondria protein homolog [Striga asiatica]|uniref:Clustered mitochondria protein homolog n=1 Tax=Striga asiatica TaxID=4170 RepID=A0A5A7PC93_STRAF|nr:clustered mitochondria protein homolog [Striga asiatica]